MLRVAYPVFTMLHDACPVLQYNMLLIPGYTLLHFAYPVFTVEFAANFCVYTTTCNLSCVYTATCCLSCVTVQYASNSWVYTTTCYLSCHIHHSYFFGMNTLRTMKAGCSGILIGLCRKRNKLFKQRTKDTCYYYLNAHGNNA